MGDVGGPILSRISMRRIGEGYLVQNFLSMHMYVTPGWLSYQIRFFDSNRNISVGAPGNLYNAWKPMEKFLAITPLSVSQLFVYKTPFDLWLRNR